MQEPSNTRRGKLWLENFPPQDQPIARLLIDNLEYIGQDELRTSLIRLTKNVAKRHNKPISLVPVRELADGQSYYGSDRNASPRLLLPGSFPGSEALVANMATGLRREGQNEGPFVAAPSLRNMRDSKCRTVLLLDDYCGTGDRVLRFLSGFRRSPTIRSWSSRHLIEFHVAAYAMTASARDRLSRILGDANVHLSRVSPTVDEVTWDEEERIQVLDFCRRYADKEPFGYGGTRGTMVFSHSVPNNLPQVLRRRAAGWNPFFEGQSAPEDILELFGQPKRELRLKRALQRLGKDPSVLGSATESDPYVRQVLLVLVALSRRNASATSIAAQLALPVWEVEMSIAKLRKWRLIDRTTNHITDAGRSELIHAKKMGLDKPTALLNGHSTPYYPSALRVGR